MNRLASLLALHERSPDDADLFYMIGHELLKAGRADESLAWLMRYVERGRDVGSAWGLIATLHEQAERLPEAQAALESGIANAIACGHPTMAAEMRERIANLFN